MSDPRPTQLAADVRACLDECESILSLAWRHRHHFEPALLNGLNHVDVEEATEKFDALVARITDLEAQVAALTQERDGWIRSAELAVQTWEAREQKQHDRAEAAEAALAQQKEEYERTVYLQYRALATTRQALDAMRRYRESQEGLPPGTLGYATEDTP